MVDIRLIGWLVTQCRIWSLLQSCSKVVWRCLDNTKLQSGSFSVCHFEDYLNWMPPCCECVWSKIRKGNEYFNAQGNVNEQDNEKVTERKLFPWIYIWTPCIALWRCHRLSSSWQSYLWIVVLRFWNAYEVHIQTIVYASRAVEHISSIVWASDTAHKVSYEYDANSIPPLVWTYAGGYC